MNLILSTCGTSILTNHLTDDGLRTLITKHTNDANPENIPIDVRRRINTHINETQIRFLDTPVNKAYLESAELAGILAFYNGQIEKKQGDVHYLLATDTWLGGITANLTKQWLEKHDINAQIIQHKDLQTANWNLFSSSLSDLVKWCDNTIEPMRPAYHTVFNLSGGFKSETGFLQILGQFYADETVYLFERSQELMRIPRLPLKMVDEETILNELYDFRRGDLGLSVSGKTSGIYWYVMGDECVLSPWGELVFRKHKSSIYKKEIYSSISPKVKFADTFMESCECENKNTEHIKRINDCIDLLAAMQELPSKPNPRKLDFKKIVAKKQGISDYECDAWHDGGAKRIFCRLVGGTIILDRLDNALH
jgi:putative CRISPR-associated protein (TIGR02619 family)